MKRALIPFLALLALAVAACGGEEEGVPAAPTVPPGATVPTTLERAVSFVTDDGITIRGHLFGAGDTAVILSHARPDDQRAWLGFARELAAEGFTALTYDFRGYGETGGEKQLGLLDRDLTAALDFMEARGFTRIYLVGASMGGTASLIVAARRDVAGVVSVSSPARFEGLDADAVVGDIDEPKLFIASIDDQSAYDSLRAFVQQATEPSDDLLLEGRAHGTELLEGEHAAEFKAQLLEFLGQAES